MPEKPKETYKLKGERYPIKSIMWQYLKAEKFELGNEMSEVIENNDLYLTI